MCVCVAVAYGSLTLLIIFSLSISVLHSLDFALAIYLSYTHTHTPSYFSVCQSFLVLDMSAIFYCIQDSYTHTHTHTHQAISLSANPFWFSTCQPSFTVFKTLTHTHTHTHTHTKLFLCLPILSGSRHVSHLLLYSRLTVAIALCYSY